MPLLLFLLLCCSVLAYLARAEESATSGAPR